MLTLKCAHYSESYLLPPSSAEFEGADETMYSCFQESQVRKLEMTECVNLSPVCLAVMCEGLLKNASLEQLVAKSSFMVSNVCT